MTSVGDPRETSQGVIEYRPQMPDGSMGPPVVTGWDVRTNRRL